MLKGWKIGYGTEENHLCSTLIQLGITGVTCACINIFQSIQEKNGEPGTEWAYTRIVSFEVGYINITIGQHACLKSPILFIFIDKMHLDFGMTRRNACTSDRPERIEGVKVLYLF